MTLDIVGAGFGRTGTSSLKIALEHLGFGPTHHMFEVRDNPHLLREWQAAARGDAIDFEAAFAGYRSQVDWPGACFWRELADYYPSSKVILTVRDADDWFDSVQATIAKFLAGRGSHPDAHANAIAQMAQELVADAIFGGSITDRQHATRVFADHIVEVKATIPQDRLLVFDVSDGWAPLCDFLGVEIPPISFPKLNSSKQFFGEEWKGSAESRRSHGSQQ